MKTAIKNTINFLKSLHIFFTHDIWVLDFSKVSRARAIFYQQILIIYLVGRAFVHDRLLIRASALVYATLLSIVPLLAVMFSLLKGFGFHNQLEPTLNQFFEPLGQQAVQTIVPTIVNFVNNVKVGALGTVGFLLLFLSVWSIVNNIERAFNDVWKIRKVRSIHRRFTDYISVLIVGPLLVFVFVGVVASLQSFVIVQTISKIPGIPYIFNKTVPFIITWLFFYFVLTYVPNTKVKLKPALTGSAISAVLWVIANYLFAHFIVSAYQYGTSAAIYAGFATLPLFLLWMFISWAIMLLGVELSYVYQNIDQISWEIRDTNYSHSVKNELALKIVLYTGQKFYNNEQAPTASELSDTFNCPLPLTHDMLALLVDQGILYIIDREPPGFVPAKSLEKIFVDEIFNKVQTSGINIIHEKEPQILNDKVLSIMNKYNKTLHRSFGQTSILDLIKEEINS
ncbi:YihY/virulence factor BrkB family protein [candidate division KSB1 bacterium]|nr:YihY/virulence factor BrkB family protein [candidate division KSB1 bacterium]